MTGAVCVGPDPGSVALSAQEDGVSNIESIGGGGDALAARGVG